MRSIGEAVREITSRFTPRGPVRVGIVEARGRFVAEGIVARRDAPAFDNSAMDGYAVRAADVATASESTPVALRVVGESRAGGPLPAGPGAGEAVRIFTGAELPTGADAVVVQEDTTREGDVVRVTFASKAGAHVRARGSDLRAGTPLVRPGDRIDPGVVALLASQGVGTVSVHRAPTVAILSTGDELRDLDEPERPGSIVGSNAYALAALVEEAGGIAWRLPTARDDVDAIAERFLQALAADVVLSTGGVSVGDHDHVKEAMERVGIPIDFWKIAMKPGKPLAFGTRAGVPVVGLPGNPVSALVTFELFVRPGLRRMIGDPRPFPERLVARLAHEHRRKAGRTELARARFERTRDGIFAHLHALQGSGSLPSMVGVDGLVVLPGERERFEPGECLDALPFGGGSGAEETFFE